MPTLRRVEFSRSLRANSPRFVLMIEIPDSAASELNARKVSLETRAYEVAFETIHADQSNKPEFHMSLKSCTKGKIKRTRGSACSPEPCCLLCLRVPPQTACFRLIG